MSARTVRRVPVRTLAVDGLVVLLLCGVMVWEYAHPRMDDGVRPPHVDLAVSVVFSVLAFAPIAVRRLYPLTALLVSGAALTVPSFVVTVDVFFWTGVAPVVFLVYTVARLRPFRWAALGGFVVVVVQAASTAPLEQAETVADSAFLLTFVALAIALGTAVRRSNAQRERLAELLERLRTEQADRERLALVDERAGLARDLHDVVAHAVSLMLVQAGAARMSLREDPALARRFLAGVEQAGREAGTDLAALLTLLRADDGTAAEARPSLTELAALADRMRRGGLDVALDVPDDLAVPSAGLDVTAYRIVQEALTNVLKHAGPTRVEVRLARDEQGLRLAVRDDGPNGPRPVATRSGHGLVGLRERAALFGGTVDARPQGRGFCLAALLPYAEVR